jgi:predicted P-loop ATPase
MQTSGVWCIELSELDALTRGEVSRIKAFISRTTDRFRPPYGSRVIESPRSCVFWGTTNSDGYLKDETGGRRFLPIQIGKIDIDGLAAARNRLWAEAVVAYRAGLPWWITNRMAESDATRHQRDRYVDDPWESVVHAFIADRSSVTIDEILRDALRLDISRCGQAEQNRVARCLRSLDWERKQVRVGGKRPWRYFKPVLPHDDEEAHEWAETGNVTSLRPAAGK